jgi:HSP20 family protein
MFDLIPKRVRESRGVTHFRRELDDLFNRFFDLDFPAPREFFKEGEWLPRVDVSEGAKEITVKAEIPGVEAKDIHIALEGRMLTVKGEKKQEKEEKEENYHRMERSYGSFSRTIELPAEVDSSNVDASYKKGILKIVLQKVKASETKKIEIKT